jgi:hypothetical protein
VVVVVAFFSSFTRSSPLPPSSCTSFYFEDVRVCAYWCLRACVCVSMCVRVNMCECVCMRVYARECVCACVNVCICT